VAHPSYEDRKQVAAANRAFYRAFETFDVGAMAAVWLDDPTVRCVHPGGELLVGHSLVLASWRSIFESTTAIRFELADLAVDVQGDMAWATCVERMGDPGDPEDISEAAATNAFLRDDDGGWRLVLHHASPITRRFTRRS